MNDVSGNSSLVRPSSLSLQVLGCLTVLTPPPPAPVFHILQRLTLVLLLLLSSWTFTPVWIWAVLTASFSISPASPLLGPQSWAGIQG